MKKLLLRISLICIILISFSSTTLASDWQWIISTDTGTYFFDKSKIKEADNNMYTAWIMVEYPSYMGEAIANKFNFRKPVARSISLVVFDIAKQTIDYKQIYVYGNDDSMLEKYRDKGIVDIVPGSKAEKLFEATFPEYKKQFNK